MITEYIKDRRWECFPTAFAMLTFPNAVGGILSPDDVMEIIGHDGSQITHAGLPEPLKRRGFHIQEIIDVALRLGFAMTEIQHSPQIVSKPWKPNLDQTDSLIRPFRIKEGDDAIRRFQGHVDSSRGILATRQKDGKSHAWAYEYGTIYDPDGNYSSMEFNEKDLANIGHFPVSLWRVDNITD